ncbi:MAG: polysaccharide biosynthesis/export family protein [Hyphomicrobiales bacterium]
MVRPGIQRIAILAALLFLTACSGIPRSGPAEVAITHGSADLAGFSLLDMTPQNVGNYLVRQTGDGAGTAGVPSAPAVVLSSGDIIKVRISESKEGGLFAPIATGGTVFDKVRVDHRGTISLPYAARVKVSGLDTQAVADRIRDKLSGVSFEPQVYVELVSDRGSSVLVGGEVKNPGRFSLLEGPLTLLDAVGKAGGATRPAHQIDVLVRRGKQVMRIPLSTVQSGRNMQLRSGDEVILEADAKVFNALGAVTKTGQVEFSKLNPSLLDALSQVGGLSNELASNTGVFVFRLREPKAWRDEDGRWHEGPAIFRFNMSRPETMFIAQVFGVVSNDTIYVTNAPSVEWMRAITPIAATMAAVNNAVNAGVRAGIITPTP